MENAKFYCGRCRMNFVVGPPHYNKSGRGHEITRCVEPSCGQRFWHSCNSHRVPPVKIGIFPKDVRSGDFALRRLAQ